MNDLLIMFAGSALILGSTLVALRMLDRQHARHMLQLRETLNSIKRIVDEIYEPVEDDAHARED